MVLLFEDPTVDEFVHQVPLLPTVLRLAGMQKSKASRSYLLIVLGSMLAVSISLPFTLSGQYEFWPSFLVWLLGLVNTHQTHSLVDTLLPGMTHWLYRTRKRSPLRAALGLPCTPAPLAPETSAPQAPLQQNWAPANSTNTTSAKARVDSHEATTLAAEGAVVSRDEHEGHDGAVLLFDPLWMVQRQTESDLRSTKLGTFAVLFLGYSMVILGNFLITDTALFPTLWLALNAYALFAAAHHFFLFIACWTAWALLTTMMRAQINFLRFEMLVTVRRLPAASLDQRIAWHRALAKMHTTIKANLDLFSLGFRWQIVSYVSLGGLSAVLSLLLALVDSHAQVLVYWSGGLLLMALLPLFVCAWVSSTWLDFRNEAIPYLTGLAISVPLEQSEAMDGGALMSLQEEQKLHAEEQRLLHRGKLRDIVSLATSPTDRFLRTQAMHPVVLGEHAELGDPLVAEKRQILREERLMLFHQISEAYVGVRVFNTPITFALVTQAASLSFTGLLILGGETAVGDIIRS